MGHLLLTMKGLLGSAHKLHVYAATCQKNMVPVYQRVMSYQVWEVEVVEEVSADA